MTPYGSDHGFGHQRRKLVVPVRLVTGPETNADLTKMVDDLVKGTLVLDPEKGQVRMIYVRGDKRRSLDGCMARLHGPGDRRQVLACEEIDEVWFSGLTSGCNLMRHLVSLV